MISEFIKNTLAASNRKLENIGLNKYECQQLHKVVRDTDTDSLHISVLPSFVWFSFP